MERRKRRFSPTQAIMPCSPLQEPGIAATYQPRSASRFRVPSRFEDSGRFVQRLIRERRSELRARTDRELAVDAREVDLDCSLSDEERLGDLAVGGAFGSHLGDTSFAGRERGDPAQCDSPRSSTGGEELLLGTRSERRGAADRRQLDRLTELLARRG